MKPRFLFLLFGCFLAACQPEQQPPVAQMKCYPSFGDTTTIIELDGSKTNSTSCYHLALRFRWDFEGDGIWDTRFEPADRILHSYLNPGVYKPRMEVKDLNDLSAIVDGTLSITGANKDVDYFIDPRDDNRYRIVKLNESWWMAENLRYGKEISTSVEQTNNGIVEMYRNHGNNNFDSIGGIYRWFEAMNYAVNNHQGICPDGWHIPSNEEYSELFAPYPMVYSTLYFGKDGLSGLNLTNSNQAVRQSGEVYWQTTDFLMAPGFLTSSHKDDGGYYLTGYQVFRSPSIWNYCRHDSDPENNPLTVHYTSVRCKKN